MTQDADPGVPPEGGAPGRAPGERGRRAAGPPDDAPGTSPDRFRAVPASAAEPAGPPAAPTSDPLAPYRPAGPTFQAEPAVRELELPMDTGRLRQLPTGQLLTVRRPAAEPAVPGVLDEEEQRRVYSGIGVVLGVVGAVASLFVGWALPVSIIAIVFGVLALRREEGGRVPAYVGIATGVTGVLFSLIWIGYYAIILGALPT
ncbi:DUF4190 domain-containing protein [Agromyces archimandritae]|uniref:DUF4190 domain-containing protein n=1 Tax=Agromyces archimandritae TaxID=2781962 RepID=A0A975IQV7_9MICO|nr:DUF4190 domain-containing protein [Agromyces archimandritae]QTX05451.1 DUF4190 domain-containing protein [Agromyces archimandritae]